MELLYTTHVKVVEKSELLEEEVVGEVLLKTQSIN